MYAVEGVDYITKPFHAGEVLARVNTHLELRNTRIELQSLLSKTLTGGVRIMIDLLTFINPSLVEKSNRIRRYAQEMIKTLPINANESWNIDLAIMLSQIGCITLPAVILKKRNSNISLNYEEQQRYEQHPNLGADIVTKIPRFGNVAEIIRHQLIHPSAIDKNVPEIVFIGSSILNLLIVFDDLILKGMTPSSAVLELKKQNPPYLSMIINCSSEIINKKVNIPKRIVKIDMLISGMILNEDILTESGQVLLAKGTELAENFIQFLQLFLKIGKCSKDYAVIIDGNN